MKIGQQSKQIGPRTNLGHQWTATSDGDRVECVWCMCSPLDQQAKQACDRFLEAQHYGEADHIPEEGSGEEPHQESLGTDCPCGVCLEMADVHNAAMDDDDG